MNASLKQNHEMNAEDLSKLTFDELNHIKNKNFALFNILVIADLIVFYHSLYTEKWLLVFLTFGIFISTFALYDNYRISRDLLEKHH